MKIEQQEFLGQIDPSGVRAYKRQPWDFSAASGYACKLAQDANENRLIVLGNSYGRRVFHIATPKDDLAKFLGFNPPAGVKGVVVTPSGHVHYARLV